MKAQGGDKTGDRTQKSKEEAKILKHGSSSLI
jgi:hypothetical protein